MTSSYSQQNIDIPDSWEDGDVPIISAPSSAQVLFIDEEDFSNFVAPIKALIVQTTTKIVEKKEKITTSTPVENPQRFNKWVKKPPTQTELRIISEKLKQKEEQKRRQLEAALKIKEKDEKQKQLIVERNLTKFGVATPNRLITRAKTIASTSVSTRLEIIEDVEVKKSDDDNKDDDNKDDDNKDDNIEDDNIEDDNIEEEEVISEEFSSIMKEWLEKKEDEIDIVEKPEPVKVSCKTRTVSQKVIPGRIDITPVSLIKQRRMERYSLLNNGGENQSEVDKRCMTRANGFNMLGDKRVMDEKLGKTKMCRSVLENTRCPHGSRCRFAHNVEEVKPSMCCFGNTCKLVVNIEGVISNRPNNKTCFFIHDEETVDAYHIRINLSIKPKKVENTQTPTPMSSVEIKSFVAAPVRESVWKKLEAPVSETPVQVVEEVQPVKKVFVPAPIKKSCWKDVNTVSQPAIQSTQKQIRIRVPSSVVEQAMRAIIESGFTKINLSVY